MFRAENSAAKGTFSSGEYWQALHIPGLIEAHLEVNHDLWIRKGILCGHADSRSVQIARGRMAPRNVDKRLEAQCMKGTTSTLHAEDIESKSEY